MSPTPRKPAREPSRRSRVVDLFAALAPKYESPHSSGGEPAERPRFEYASADEFWRITGFDPVRLVGADVLDIGCGWGGKAVRYAEVTGLRSMTGIDLPVFEPAVALAFAREHGVADRCSFCVADAGELPFEDKSFDVIIMEDVLEHVDDPAQVLNEVHRVLRLGGWMVARFPSFRMLNAHHLDRAVHIPGLHYLLPMRIWAAGLNSYRDRHGVTWEPFSAVIHTRFRRNVTANLNGMTFGDFRSIARESQLVVERMELVPYTAARFGILSPIYSLMLYLFREQMSRTIAFVAERH